MWLRVIGFLATLAMGLAIAGGGATAATEDARIGAVSSIAGLGSPGTVSFVMTCPGEQRALGGGIVQSSASPPDDLVLRASGPLAQGGSYAGTEDGDKPRRWLAAASNESASPVDLRGFVVCANSDVRLEVKQFENDPGDAERVTVKCPSGRRAVGGGVMQKGSVGNSYVKETGPTSGQGSYGDIETGDIPRGWQGLMQNQGSASFKVFAICSHDSRAKIKVKERRLPGDAGGRDADAHCPSGKRALSGGVVHNRSDLSVFSATPTGPLDNTGEAFGTDVGDKPVIWHGGLNSIFGGSARFKVLAVCE